MRLPPNALAVPSTAKPVMDGVKMSAKNKYRDASMSVCTAGGLSLVNWAGGVLLSTAGLRVSKMFNGHTAHAGPIACRTERTWLSVADF